MRVLVIGAGGFIGRHLARRLGGEAVHEVHATFRSGSPPPDGNSWHRVELMDSSSLSHAFRLARPDAVVHLAAIADVGTAERDRDAATAVNVGATSAIARLCSQYNAGLVFVSTEYVFDGTRGFYREDDSPSPATHYGRTKHEAEREVASLASRWSILRTSIVYGWPAPGRRNFVPWLVERLAGGQPYHGPRDVLRTPVYVEHLVDGLARLVEGDFPGIHHIAGRDLVSMYDFALRVADGFNLDRQLVVPADPDEGRPPDRLGLDCASTYRVLGLSQPGLDEGIADMRASAPSR